MAMKIAINIKKLTESAVIPKYETDGAAGFDLHADTGGEPIILPPAKVQRLEPKKKGLARIGQAAAEIFKGVEVKAVPSRTLIKTGLAVSLPQSFELQVRSRSGLALKQGLQAHVGTVDSDYRGEVGVILFNFGSEHITINHGDRIAQGVINRIEQAGFFEVNELDETPRGDHAYGSTGGSDALLNKLYNDTAAAITAAQQGVPLGKQ
jgi:dUTP pyrophosphatase